MVSGGVCVQILDNVGTRSDFGETAAWRSSRLLMTDTIDKVGHEIRALTGKLNFSASLLV
jgi:hypothetical protein